MLYYAPDLSPDDDMPCRTRPHYHVPPSNRPDAGAMMDNDMTKDITMPVKYMQRIIRAMLGKN